MKQILLLLITFCIPSVLLAQEDGSNWDFSMLTDSTALETQLPNTLEGWKEQLENFGSKVPQEEIFVHMDNTCYFVGDTLYFKAYVRRSDTGRLSDLSQLLYAELWNQDGYLVERQNIRLQGGQGAGSFCLKDSLYGGFYELRAYTRWQLNWGEYEHAHTWSAEKFFLTHKMAKEYYRDYEKLYSRIFPLYDKPKEPGDYTHEMTTRPLQRYFKSDPTRPDPVATFYPEGGVLVEGTKARMAFEANEQDGEHIDGTMRVTDHKDQLVAEAHTENRGRGLLEFYYEPGESYKAVFTSDSNRVIRVKVPLAEKDGCTVRTDVEGNELHLNLQPRGRAARETLGVTVMTGGALHFFRKFSAEDTDFRIPTDSLPSGVAQVTVYNAEGRVYSDRLIFIRHSDLDESKVEFSGIEDMYQPYDSIHLTVSNPFAPGSLISLAVRDAAYSEYLYDSSNMLTEMLLCSQIKGFVEQPDYYFEADDEVHRRHLDLLLLVQGWRRHNWISMATPGIFRINHPIESTPIYFGTVNRYVHLGREGEEDFTGDFYNVRDVQEFDFTKPGGGQNNFFMRRGSPKGVAVPTLGSAMEARERNTAFMHLLKDKKGLSDNLNYYSRGDLKHEVLVHAEFSKPTSSGSHDAVGEVPTKDGRFILQMPFFYGSCKLNLTAADTTKWTTKKALRKERRRQKKLAKGKKQPEAHPWVVPDEMEYPEFYVRLTPYHPRFVKPFSYYHTHVAPFREGTALIPSLKDTRNLAEVTVRSRFGGLRSYSENHPALVMDAYEAFNQCADAGFTPAWYAGPTNFTQWLQRLFVGDMNEYRNYQTGPGYSNIPITIPFGGIRYSSPFGPPSGLGSNSVFHNIWDINLSDDKRKESGVAGRWEWEDPSDAIERNIRSSRTEEYRNGIDYYANVGRTTKQGLSLWSSGFSLINRAKARIGFLAALKLENLASIKLVTDYNPRMEGNKHYKGATQPTVNISFSTFPKGGRRLTYRDRHYVVQGFSVCEEFYQPNYSQRPLPETKDYRRTLYWNPFLRLDEDGEAEVSFYNNGKPTTITVSAEGISRKGQIVTGISYPEDR